jgi:hypothetical protein
MGYFVTELKTGKFQPEYAAKLNFCIALVDDKHRREAHADTVGILICGSMNDHSVRYSLAARPHPGPWPPTLRRPARRRSQRTARHRPAHCRTGLDRGHRRLKTAAARGPFRLRDSPLAFDSALDPRPGGPLLIPNLFRFADPPVVSPEWKYRPIGVGCPVR